jgi:hypothetical protein
MEIEGYSNYLIYPDGRVQNKKTGIFKKTSIGKRGYETVSLYKNNKEKTFTIHRLIAQYYIPNPNPNEYKQVDHKDEDKTNNEISNLRWCNQSQNCQNRSARKDNKLGIKNITACGNSYVFEKKYRGNRHTKCFKTLEEAIEYKEHFLKDLNDNFIKS